MLGAYAPEWINSQATYSSRRRRNVVYLQLKRSHSIASSDLSYLRQASSPARRSVAMSI